MTWMIEAFQHLIDGTTTYGDRLFLGAIALAWIGAICFFVGTRRTDIRPALKGDER